MMQYVKPKKIGLKGHPEFSEKWVHEIIAEDPSILGLGDLILKDKERIQPGAGRLDLLLQDSDSTRRFEVEIQLGRTDESHIIRTIEYWDIERKRYPQYEHCAVIIAEDITSRFLNVISLFNGNIPLVAIQMNAFQIDDNISLVFTTVLNQLTLGLTEEDEEVYEATDRLYWEKKANKGTVEMVDELLALLHTFEPKIGLKYNKFYIGLTTDAQANNFVLFKPKKGFVRAEMRLTYDKELEEKIENAGLDLMNYNIMSGRYKIRLTNNDVQKHRDLLIELLKLSYQQFNGI